MIECLQTADEFMIAFRRTFLVGSVWIAVKNMGPLLSAAVEFDCFGVGEFTSVICQADREKACKPFMTEQTV